VIPLLITEIQKRQQSFDFQDFDKDTNQPLELKPHVKNMCQSSVIGWFTGLLPGLSYILSATIAYNWQRKKQIRAGTYQRGNMPSVISAETSNTAGAVSTLLPLLVFGIPITGSETIIYNLMLLNGADFAQGKFFLNNLGYVAVALTMATAIGLLFCWPMSKFFGNLLSKIKLSWLWMLIIMIVVASVLYIGWYNSQLQFYVISFLVMIIIGMMIRNRLDPMSVIFMFVMQNSIDQAIMIFVQLYF
jgi:putative tricarboxylic transport membrane protein